MLRDLDPQGAIIEVHLAKDFKGKLIVTVSGNTQHLNKLGFNGGMFDSLANWIDFICKRNFETKKEHYVRDRICDKKHD